jgi:hypothetical protein
LSETKIFPEVFNLLEHRLAAGFDAGTQLIINICKVWEWIG